MKKSLFVYVDMDDTLICKRTGAEGRPVPKVVEHVCHLHHQGAKLYC